MKTQVNKAHYDFKKYINKPRWMSYYYQLKFIYELKPGKVLEIGTGNNFLKKQLSKEMIYKTMDIADDLNPDILGSVNNIPLKDNSFDLICCFQVLEHLPFNLFEKSIKEIVRVSKKNAFISLPCCSLQPTFGFKIPLISEFRISLNIPKFWKKYKFDGEHYWEIGSHGYSKKRIINILKKYFIIKKIIHPNENKYHIFFILEKKR